MLGKNSGVKAVGIHKAGKPILLFQKEEKGNCTMLSPPQLPWQSCTELLRAVEVAIHFDHLKLCCLAGWDVKNSSEWCFLASWGPRGLLEFTGMEKTRETRKQRIEGRTNFETATPGSLWQRFLDFYQMQLPHVLSQSCDCRDSTSGNYLPSSPRRPPATCSYRLRTGEM